MFIVTLCLRLTIGGSLPFRSTGRAVRIFCSEIPELHDETVPSYWTIERWASTVGYYKLIHPKVMADDWLIIIDLSIQIGTQKCLTILGCRRSDLPKGQALTLEDLEPLELRIESTINGEVIRESLEAVTKKVGRIYGICSDEGSEVLAGIRCYQADHPETINILDIAHKMALFLKHRLEGNTTWKVFCSKASEVRTKVQQTDAAPIAPPSQRSKARFMNLDTLIKWAEKMLCLLDNPEEIDGFDSQLLEEHLAWLREYSPVIEHYTRLITVTGLARHIVREKGICAESVEEFESEAFLLDLSTDECQFVGQISDFLQEQYDKTTDAEAVLGSTEILESFFGKFKSMEGDQCRFGFTGLILAAYAHIGPLDDETIQEALTSIKWKEVDSWIKEHLGVTIQSIRRKLGAAVKRIFKGKVAQETDPILEGEALGF